MENTSAFLDSKKYVEHSATRFLKRLQDIKYDVTGDDSAVVPSISQWLSITDINWALTSGQEDALHTSTPDAMKGAVDSLGS